MSEARAITRMSNKGIVISDVDSLARWSKIVAASKDMCPKNFQGKPEAIAVAIQQGAELGLTPMKSLQSIAVINGRATLWGDTALGLVRASGLCEFIKEEVTGEKDGRMAICESKRKDSSDSIVTTFSVQNAIQAGLWGKGGTWKQYPERMLKYRARGFNLRDNFPDVLCGFHITEEMDFPEPSYQPTTPRREERKKVENTAVEIYNKEAIQAVADAFESISECQDNIEEEFLAFVAREAGGDPPDYRDPKAFTIEVLDKLSIALQDWKESQDGTD